jgi:hypothetical protein
MGVNSSALEVSHFGFQGIEECCSGHTGNFLEFSLEDFIEPREQSWDTDEDSWLHNSEIILELLHIS